MVLQGRMPFAELADSIVQTSRETLQNAIKLVEDHPGWHAKVKYGDTDSMFVLLEGRTREEAFRIGKVNKVAHLDHCEYYVLVCSLSCGLHCRKLLQLLQLQIPARSS